MTTVDKKIKSVCVYCGSGFGGDARYRQSATDLGEWIVAQDLKLVYGGGGVGLMGEVARTVHERSGKVLGIMPTFLRTREILFDDVETRVVETMHERKMMMFEESDAFLVLPGGIGTLEEVIELLSWRRLDLHRKPVIFLNIANYWTPLFDMIGHTMAERFTPDNFGLTYRVAAEVNQVTDCLNAMIVRSDVLDTRRVI